MSLVFFSNIMRKMKGGAFLMAAAQYVKFLRGSQAAFNNLSNKDDATLYFIKNIDSDNIIQSYSIYLGDKPINGGSLENLVDLNLSNLQLNDLLLYDSKNKQWINKDLNSFIQMLNIPEVFTGAVDGESGQDGTKGLVPSPTKGQANFFLKGDGTWSDLTPIVNAEIAKVVGSAPEAFDTLEEIANWIEDDQTGAAALATKVGNLEDSIKGQSEEIIKLNTSVGTLQTDVRDLQNTVNDLITGGDVDLTGYITKTEFTTVVGDLTSLKNYVENTNIVNEINQINERLTWQDL